MVGLEEITEAFEEDIANANIFLIDAISDFNVSYEEKNIYEAAGDPLIVKFKKFIVKIITALEKFIASIKNQIESGLLRSEYKVNLRKAHAELKEKKARGVKTVVVYDVWSLKDLYIEATEKLSKYMKRFTKMNYKNTMDLEKDIEKFEKLYEKYNDEATYLSEKQVKVSVDKMLKFIESETAGNSRVMATLNDARDLFREMGTNVEILIKQADMLGPDVINKHVGCIRRMINKFIDFIKKWIVKFVVACCIIVG